MNKPTPETMRDTAQDAHRVIGGLVHRLYGQEGYGIPAILGALRIVTMEMEAVIRHQLATSFIDADRERAKEQP